MQSRDQIRGASCELELCLCRTDCGDGLIETLRVAFELEMNYRDERLQELMEDSSSGASEPPRVLTSSKCPHQGEQRKRR
jgi:hypothetical protein